MTKRITSEDCEGNNQDIEDGRYNTHVVPVASEDDPGYEEIDYANCTEFTVPLGRYGSHVVPIGGTPSGDGEIIDNTLCPGGGLQHNVNVDGSHCIAISLKPGGAIIIDNNQLAIDTTKLRVTTDNVYPAGSNPGIVYTGPDGEVWDTQEDYNHWLYETISDFEPYDDSALWEDQQRQDKELADFKKEVELDQERQDKELADYKKEVELDQKRQDDEFKADQERQDNEIESLKELLGGSGVGEPDGQCGELIGGHGYDQQYVRKSGDPEVHWSYSGTASHYNVDLGPSFATLCGDRSTRAPQPGQWLTVKDELGGYFKGKVKSLYTTQVTNQYGFHWEWTHYQLEGVEDSTTVGELATVCAEDSINEDPSYNFVTHPEFETDQKRQDDALSDEIKSREERDLLHDAQLNTIEYKLDALLGLQFKGIYEFKHENDCNLEYERCVENCMAIDPQDHECRQMCGRNQMDCEREKVRPGYFEAVDPDDQFDHLEYIVISKSDKAGVEIEWANVLKKDDYLEVDHTAQGVLDKTNYGLYRIIEEPEETTNAYGEPVYTLHLEFLQGDGEMNVRENYEIRGITAAEGVNPEELGDFLTKEEAAATYALKTHGHAWGDITGKPSTYPPSSHTHSDYVSKSTTSDQELKSNLKGKYFYGLTSSRNDGMMCRKDIEALVSSSGGGSDGSDHNHDGRYPKMSTGSSTYPSPGTGDFYLDTSRKILYIGT